MRVVIAGAGRSGIAVGAHLLEAGHDVALIDRDPAIARRAFEMHGLVSMAGDAADPSFVKLAEIDRADVVVAMLPRDADNLAVAVLAQSAGAKRVMVRMREPAFRPIYVAAGVQRILSETEVFIGALATAIEHEAVRHSMILGQGDAVAFELVLPAQAQVAGRSVSEIAADPDFPKTVVFAGMTSPDGFEAPRGASVVRAGMTLLLVAARHEIATVIEFFLQGRVSRLPDAVRRASRPEG
jgi:trk system potassium uptake protein TrkA